MYIYFYSLDSMYLLDNSFRKDLKNKMAKKLQDWIDNFVDEKYDNKLVAFLIRACHLHTPVYCMIGMVSLPFFFAIWIYIWVFLVFFMFIYLRGCFLSVTEYRLSDEDITIADPVIMLCRDNITPENRVWYSITVIAIYLIIATCVMLYRFYS